MFLTSNAGLKALRAVIMKITVCWDETLCWVAVIQKLRTNLMNSYLGHRKEAISFHQDGTRRYITERTKLQ